MALVVKDRVIEAARVTLPFSQTSTLGDVVLGMRHRSALGISEQADVLVVVVSQESGMISIADNGKLIRGLTIAELRRELHQRLSMPTGKGATGIWDRLRGRN
jgi:diadenylate cyclase